MIISLEIVDFCCCRRRCGEIKVVPADFLCLSLLVSSVFVVGQFFFIFCFAFSASQETDGSLKSQDGLFAYFI